MALDALYTSAPILDYEESDDKTTDSGDLFEAPGAATLAPEAFDAAILEALVSP
jgi:hypothetical protein